MSVWADEDGDGEYETEITASDSTTDSFEPTYEITAVNATDGNIYVEFEPLTDDADGGTVIAAAYDADGTLVGIDLETDLSAGSTVLTPTLETMAYVKVFIWDGFDRMIPLCEAVTAAVE